MDTTQFSADELQESARLIASLVSKSQKALKKLTSGTWQHTMLSDNLKALGGAFVIMTKTETKNRFVREELDESVLVLSKMLNRVAQSQDKFSPGTSRHSLQRNRQKALRIAVSLVESEMNLI